MPSSSRTSRATALSLRTVDDVLECLSIHEEQVGDISRDDAVDFVSSVCGTDTRLARDTKRALDSVVSHLAPVCPNPKSLVESMQECNAVLGGVQATSFFYPIATFTQAPWDFYCDSRSDTAETFIRKVKEITLHEVIQDTKTSKGYRTLHLRGNVNGSLGNIDVRVYSGPMDPYSSVLLLGLSYEQSLLGACGGVCFWPKLNKDRVYRAFASNPGNSLYPRCDAHCRTTVSRLTRVVPRVGTTTKSIYSSTDKRTKVVLFPNECLIPRALYSEQANILKEIVYAVSPNATMFLGSTAGMD